MRMLKKSLQILLGQKRVGQNAVTVSTAGVIPVMQKLLEDPDWPNVKIAISLHSADVDLRKSIVPAQTPGFLDKLKKWCLDYERIRGARTRPLTFEYVLLRNTNDRPEDAVLLKEYLKKIGRKKVNLIPFNPIPGDSYERSTSERVAAFQKELGKGGIVSTVRKTKGKDIKAACGQLVTSTVTA